MIVFKILIFNFLFTNMFAQEYCFFDNSINISFEIRDSILRFGVWEAIEENKHYLFYGKKHENILDITFIDTLQNHAVNENWTLTKDILIIPNSSSKDTNDLSKIMSCRDEITPITNTEMSPCYCVAYINDPDKNGLNIRSEGNVNAAILAKIPYSDETKVLLTGTNRNGWVAISNVPYLDDKPVPKPGFVYAQKLGISTGGYETGSIPLFSTPDKKTILRYIPSDQKVTIMDCKDTWLKIKYKKFIGWIALDDQCPNKILNCNN